MQMQKVSTACKFRNKSHFLYSILEATYATTEAVCHSLTFVLQPSRCHAQRLVTLSTSAFSSFTETFDIPSLHIPLYRNFFPSEPSYHSNPTLSTFYTENRKSRPTTLSRHTTTSCCFLLTPYARLFPEIADPAIRSGVPAGHQPQTGGVHAAPQSGGHVCFTQSGRRDGCVDWRGGRIQHPIRGQD